jgi:hypothetical protein
LTKKFHNITIPTAIARVRFLAMNSGVREPIIKEDRKKFTSGGSTKCRIGIRIATPARLTATNIPI